MSFFTGLGGWQPALAVYNELEPYAAQWLRNLEANDHIAPGHILEQSITMLNTKEFINVLQSHPQAHFFAGIGVWSHALRLAGWPDDVPVWTGSCPCQPYSIAGRGKGKDDERHLWPAWFKLIKKCRPPVILGEQVASPAGLGWLDDVQADLEKEDYAVGAFDICAAGFGAPHIRQRLYLCAYDTRSMADAPSRRRFGRRFADARNGANTPWQQPERLRDARRVADSNGVAGRQGSANLRGRSARGDALEGSGPRRDGESLRLADANHATRSVHVRPRQPREEEPAAGRRGEALGLGNAHGEHPGRYGSPSSRAQAPGEAEREEARRVSDAARASGATRGFWSSAEWVPCDDGVWRPVGPGVFPLAHGTTERVGRLRAYGNGLVAPQAATFIEAVMQFFAQS